VPAMAQHESLREEEITQEVPSTVEILWKASNRGRASPV
jgi:hypothetical protein